MKNIDLKSLSGEEYYNYALRTTNLVIKGHKSPEIVYKTCRISRATMYNWLTKRKKLGLKGLQRKKGKVGQKKKSSNNLSDKEMKLLVSMIHGEPKDIENKKVKKCGLFDVQSLRTITMIQKLIEIVFEKELKWWKVRDILINDLGWTNQIPDFKAYQQDPEKVKKWKEKDLPKIREEAKKEKREILYGDECGFRSNNHKGKTWAPKGKTPTVKSNGARFGVNAISAISPYGGLKFMVYEGSFNSKTLIKFLRRLVYNTKKKYTLILDGHPTHHTKKTDAYLKSINNQIRLYYLPGYSPELNPDENIRAWSKNDLKGQIFADKKTLAKGVRKSLHKLQKDEPKVSSYFLNDKIGFMSK